LYPFFSSLSYNLGVFWDMAPPTPGKGDWVPLPPPARAAVFLLLVAPPSFSSCSKAKLFPSQPWTFCLAFVTVYQFPPSYFPWLPRSKFPAFNVLIRSSFSQSQCPHPSCFFGTRAALPGIFARRGAAFLPLARGRAADPSPHYGGRGDFKQFSLMFHGLQELFFPKTYAGPFFPLPLPARLFL